MTIEKDWPPVSDNPVPLSPAQQAERELLLKEANAKGLSIVDILDDFQDPDTLTMPDEK